MSLGTRRRILDATIDVINSRGEAAVRLVHVARAASVTPSVISYHFGSREQLVAEAQAARYVVEVSPDAELLARAVSTSSDGDDFRAACRDVIAALVDTERAAERFKQASALGAAIERPELRELLGQQQREVTDRMAAAVDAAQQRGLVCAELDPRCVAEVFGALAFGVVLSDLDGAPSDRDGIVAVLDRLVDGLVAA